MMKQKLFLLIVIFLVSLTFVNAEGVILKEENVVDEIRDNNFASFDLIVENDDRKERDIFITFPYSSDWRVNVNPYLLRIPSKSSQTAKVQIFSLNEKNVGSYQLVFNVKSRDGEINENYIHKVKIFPFEGDEVAMQLVVPERIDPRTSGKIKLKVENMRKTGFDDLEINVKSEDVFSEKRFIDLNVEEIKLEEFSFSFPENLEPGRYKVEATAKYGNKEVGKDADDFILASFSDVVERKTEDNSLLVKKTILSKINGGTEGKEESMVYSVSMVKKLFTRFSKEPDNFEKKGDEYVAKWDFVLDSGDVFKVEVINDYTFAFWSCIVIILVLIFIFQMKKKRIIVSKKIMKVHKDKEGISGMKVLLNIKNRGRRPIEDIKLIDVLPMFIGTDPHSFGTLHPSKIEKTALGNVKMIWHIDELRGREERIISYVAKSRLSIIGKLILTSAVAVYKRGKKTIKSRSNKLTLLTTLKDE